jgi:hypothetical protein
MRGDCRLNLVFFLMFIIYEIKREDSVINYEACHDE